MDANAHRPNPDSATGGITARTRALLEALHRAGPGPYAAADAATLWDLDPKVAARRMRMLAERGWLTRAHHGLYSLVPLDAAVSGEWIDDPWLVVAKLYPTGYIGGWSACEHWGLTDQLFREIVVFTPDRGAPRHADAGVTPIRIKFVKPSKVFGTTTVWRRNVRVNVSDPSRTVVDLLDDPAIGGGIRQVADVTDTYLSGDNQNEELLIEYSDRLGNRAVFKRLGYLAEMSDPRSALLVEACRSRISTGVSLLDPSSPATGPIVTRWNLRINVDISR